MKKWEYLAISLRETSSLGATLNAYGEVGWELVSVYRSIFTAWIIVTFKRPKL